MNKKLFYLLLSLIALSCSNDDAPSTTNNIMVGDKKFDLYTKNMKSLISESSSGITRRLLQLDAVPNSQGSPETLKISFAYPENTSNFSGTYDIVSNNSALQQDKAYVSYVKNMAENNSISVYNSTSGSVTIEQKANHVLKVTFNNVGASLFSTYPYWYTEPVTSLQITGYVNGKFIDGE